MRLECARPPMPDLYLFHSRDKCVSKLRELGWDGDGPLGTDAQTWLVGRSAVVLIEYSGDWHSEAAMLCHEAVHVADGWLRALGEDRPTDEERAYLTQCVAEPLFRGHERWKERHGFLV